MSPVVDASLFELIHLPQTIEKLVFSPTGAAEQGRHDRRRRRRRHHHHHHHGDDKAGMGAVPVDILETPKAYTFFLDVPGLSKSDIQVTVEDERVLVIRGSGKRKREEGGEEEEEEEEEEVCKYLRLERKAGSPRFLRKFRLPEDSDVAKIAARCENGELRLTVEKRPSPEAPKPKTVEVSIA